MEQENLTINKNTLPVPPVQLFSGQYRLLSRSSWQLGRAATKAFSSINEVVHQNAFINSIEQFIAHSRTTAKAELAKVHDKISRSNELLATASSVFPFTLFPDTITVDRTKVTITRRSFFWSAEVMSLRIEDILNISAAVGPFFGSLTIATRVMSSVDHFKIDNFWRADAIQLSRIIQGYIIAQQSGLDTSALTVDELVSVLTKIGREQA